jgi:CheY-like chemotaxis protein
MRGMKAKVLIVDDDDLSPLFLEKLLGKHFDFAYAPSGEAALEVVATENPAVILMDVEMPGGMNGYETCRAIKDNRTAEGIPVIFISAHNDAENRLKAYHSGGDDYVSKPFNVEELKHKVLLALANQEKRNDLTEKARRATNVAMMSMRDSADAGVIFGFLRDIIRHTDLEEIAAATLSTLLKFQIEGAVQLRHGEVRVSRNSRGACAPVEDAVLAEMAASGRIVDIGNRSAFNYERATIIIYEMPLQDQALYGRLKDTVLKMTEVLDVHLSSLEALVAAIERGDTLTVQIKNNAALAQNIQTRLRAQRDEHQRTMKRLTETIERLTDAPEQAGAQKLLLQTLALDTRAQAQAALDFMVDLEKLLAGFDSDLPDLPANDSRPLAGPADTTFNSVELF